MYGMNLNCFAGNFASYIKNFTDQIWYGVTSNGSMFSLLPESFTGGMTPQNAGIYVETKVVGDQVTGRIDNLASKMYNPPLPQYPLYIEEHNVILFASAEERSSATAMYENGAKMVKSYAAGMVNLINASYKSITCLNKDRSFYTLSSSGIVKIPVADDAYIAEVLRKNRIAEEILDTNDVFIISTIVKNTRTEGQRETTVNTEVKVIERRKVIKGEPIITEAEGIVIFDGRANAEDFVTNYGTIGNYMIKKALKVTDKIHQEQISEINEQVKKDKRGMVETFGLMGATSVVSILTENVIKSYNSGDDEMIKKSFKILGVGVVGCGAVFGIYKGIRWLQKKAEERKESEEE